MPNHLRQESWTDLYAQVLYHPTNGQAAINLPDDEYVPIHLQVNGYELQSLLNIFIIDGAITQEEANNIISQIQINAGKKVKIIDFIPDSWKQWVYNYTQMKDMGWFVVDGV
jgi:hypothetical protein